TPFLDERGRLAGWVMTLRQTAKEQDLSTEEIEYKDRVTLESGLDLLLEYRKQEQRGFRELDIAEQAMLQEIAECVQEAVNTGSMPAEKWQEIQAGMISLFGEDSQQMRTLKTLQDCFTNSLAI